jgi:hypothetical protein
LLINQLGGAATLFGRCPNRLLDGSQIPDDFQPLKAEQPFGSILKTMLYPIS